MQRRHADVAQLVEQLIRNQQVIGSSPIVGSITIRRPFLPRKIQSSQISYFAAPLNVRDSKKQVLD